MRYAILVLCLLIPLVSCSNGNAEGLCSKIRKTAESLYKYEYVWGGDNPQEDGGLDCSGYIHYISKQIGRPLPRTTSKKYYITAEADDVHWKQASCGFFIWWQFTPDRPYGHIGIHLNPPHEVTQSGSSTGPTEIKLMDDNYWDKNFEASKEIF